MEFLLKYNKELDKLNKLSTLFVNSMIHGYSTTGWLKLIEDEYSLTICYPNSI